MASSMKLSIALLAASQADGLTLSSTVARANPIRRVVTLLQKMEEKATELHEAFMCQCKTSNREYTQSISDGGAKVESLASSLESLKGQKTQLASDLSGHKADREAAKVALADAKALREKEASAFAGVKAEQETNIAAMGKAVAAIEKGEAGSFLQTNVAQKLRDLASSNMNMPGDSRQEILAFLSGGSEESGAGSGEIVGILKQLGDEMTADLAAATKAENGSIADYNGLVAAKNEEVATLTTAIEDKITRLGETGLAIEDTKADAKDTAEKLVADKQFLADLTSECAKKEADWAAISKERQAELLAIADTIKMLNDDEALELFKKTLPSASSFMQLRESAATVRSRALAAIRAPHLRSQHLDLIALALHGKTADFSKVIGMIDEMVSVLQAEQKDDEEKSEYCKTEIDATEDKLKGFALEIKDSEAAIADAKETLATVDQEMAALVAGLKELDASVDAATEQREKENAGFKELRAGNTAAKDLIEMAKKRLNKFYNPKLALLATSSLSVHEAPALFQKSGEEATGVIAMMDGLVAELDKETQIAETDEKDAQADYETFMADSKKMRIDNTKILEDKTAAKADAIGAQETHEESLAVAGKKQKGAQDQLGVLHSDCDWLLANFDSRKEARSDEEESLKKAKAVLSGADA